MSHPGKLDGELGVLVSLVVSLAMVILTVVAWWLWNSFPGLMAVPIPVSSIEIP